MNFKEFKLTLERQIGKMSHIEKIDFAIGICKRLYPEYQNFYQVNKWGNPDLLIDGIVFCELNKVNNQIDHRAVAELISKINSIIPHTADFGNWDGSYALNASTSVAECLEYLIYSDESHIVNIAIYMTDTIDFKIQENELIDSDTDNHPVMQKEYLDLIEKTK